MRTQIYVSVDRPSTSYVIERGTNLDPERSSLPNGGELRRLVVGKAESRHIFVLTGEIGES